MGKLIYNEFDEKIEKIIVGVSAYDRSFTFGFHLAQALYEMNKTIPNFSEVIFKTMRETIEEMKEQRK